MQVWCTLQTECDEEEILKMLFFKETWHIQNLFVQEMPLMDFEIGRALSIELFILAAGCSKKRSLFILS